MEGKFSLGAMLRCADTLWFCGNRAMGSACGVRSLFNVRSCLLSVVCVYECCIEEPIPYMVPGIQIVPDWGVKSIHSRSPRDRQDPFELAGFLHCQPSTQKPRIVLRPSILGPGFFYGRSRNDAYVRDPASYKSLPCVVARLARRPAVLRSDVFRGAHHTGMS